MGGWVVCQDCVWVVCVCACVCGDGGVEGECKAWGLRMSVRARVARAGGVTMQHLYGDVRHGLALTGICRNQRLQMTGHQTYGRVRRSTPRVSVGVGRARGGVGRVVEGVRVRIVVVFVGVIQGFQHLKVPRVGTYE